MEHVVPSLWLMIADRLLPNDSMVYRLDVMHELDEIRLRSIMLLQDIQQRRKMLVARHSIVHIFERGQLVLTFNSKMGKMPRKIKIAMVWAFLDLCGLWSDVFLSCGSAG